MSCGASTRRRQTIEVLAGRLAAEALDVVRPAHDDAEEGVSVQGMFRIIGSRLPAHGERGRGASQDIQRGASEECPAEMV